MDGLYFYLCLILDGIGGLSWMGCSFVLDKDFYITLFLAFDFLRRCIWVQHLILVNTIFNHINFTCLLVAYIFRCKSYIIPFLSGSYGLPCPFLEDFVFRISESVALDNIPADISKLVCVQKKAGCVFCCRQVLYSALVVEVSKGYSQPCSRFP